MEDKDFIYTKGYPIKNVLMENDIFTSNKKNSKTKTGGFLNMENLAIPFSLYVLQRTMIPKSQNVEHGRNVQIVDESLYDKLVNFASPNPRRQERDTKKRKRGRKNLTRKNKK